VLPADNAVTTPVPLIVATDVFDDDQVPPAVVSAKADVPPTHKLVVPVIAPTVGQGLTPPPPVLPVVPPAPGLVHLLIMFTGNIILSLQPKLLLT